MTYIDDVAEAVRAEVPTRLVPRADARDLFLHYAVLTLAKGAAVEARDVHNAWSAWMVGRGEAHEAIVEFEALPIDVRDRDEPFVQAIRSVAAYLADG